MIPRGHIGATIAALLATSLLLALGLVSFHHEIAGNKPVVLPFDSFWCAGDEDCAVVDRIGCCACSEGGAQGAVTKWHTDELRLFLKSACRPRPVCVQLDLCRNDVKPVCEKHNCRLVPDPSRDASREAEPAPPLQGAAP